MGLHSCMHDQGQAEAPNCLDIGFNDKTKCGQPSILSGTQMTSKTHRNKLTLYLRCCHHTENEDSISNDALNTNKHGVALLSFPEQAQPCLPSQDACNMKLAQSVDCLAALADAISSTTV